MKLTLTKPLIIAALVAGNLVAWNFVLHAQETTNAPAATPHHARPGMEQMAQQLNLTDDQKPKVKAVLQDMQQQMKDLRADTSLSQEDRRTKMLAIRSGTTDKLKAILTPDQFAKWQSMTQRGHRPAPASTTSTNAAPQQ